jgi:hypothetical protein
MERIFENLYRTTDEPFRNGRRYSYLLVREQGNLLLPFQATSVEHRTGRIPSGQGMSMAGSWIGSSIAL